MRETNSHDAGPAMTSDLTALVTYDIFLPEKYVF